VEGSYNAPVNQLLSLGEPKGSEWRDYAALAISSGNIPDLIRMATDEALNSAPGNSNLVWAPIHAWRALGQLRATQASQPLLTLLPRIDDFQDDWVGSDLPDVLARMGETAIEPAANYLAATSHGQWARIAAAEILGEIGRTHPDLRTECVTRLAAQLERFSEQSETFNAFLVLPLWDLRAVEVMPLIERAFAAGLVDESVMGDVEDVQIQLGLKTEREHPPKPTRVTNFNGELARLREYLDVLEEENAGLRPDFDDIAYDPTTAPYVAPPKIGRNEPCPCGSGKKYKKCCGV
jgi:hypothetical protein